MGATESSDEILQTRHSEIESEISLLQAKIDVRREKLRRQHKRTGASAMYDKDREIVNLSGMIDALDRERTGLEGVNAHSNTKKQIMKQRRTEVRLGTSLIQEAKTSKRDMQKLAKDLRKVGGKMGVLEVVAALQDNLQDLSILDMIPGDPDADVEDLKESTREALVLDSIDDFAPRIRDSAHSVPKQKAVSTDGIAVDDVND